MKDQFFDDDRLHLLQLAQNGKIIGDITNERVSCDETTTPAFNTVATYPLKPSGQRFLNNASIVNVISAITGSGGTSIRGVNALGLHMYKRWELIQDGDIVDTAYPDCVYHNLKQYKNSDEYACISQQLGIAASGTRDTLAGSAQTFNIPLKLLFAIFSKPLPRFLLKGNVEIKGYLRDNVRYCIQTDKTSPTFSITDTYLDLEYINPKKNIIEATAKMYADNGFISQPAFNVDHTIVTKAIQSSETSVVLNLPQLKGKRIIDLLVLLRASALSDTNDASDYTDTFIAPTSWNLKSGGKYLNYGLQQDITKTYYDRVILPKLELKGWKNLLSGTGSGNEFLVSYANDHKVETSEFKRYHGGRFFDENDVQLTVNFSALAAQTDIIVHIRSASRYVIADGKIKTVMEKDPFELIMDNLPNISFICAAPKSGKTYMIKYLINELFRTKKAKYGLCFCPTAWNGAYDYLPKEYVHSQYNEDTLINLYNIQIEQHKKHGKAPLAFVIFDDCIGSINFESAKFKKIISTFRHPNILFIFTTQYIKELPTLLRECSTYFITFKQTKKLSIDAIYENFMYEFDTLKEAKKFLEANTKVKYHFILMDVEDGGNQKDNDNEGDEEIEQKYYFGKAPDDFKQIKIKF